MPIAAQDPIVVRLEALVQEHPELADAAALYQAVLPRLRDADLCVAPVALSHEEARAKLAAGEPLLSNVDLAFDEGAASDLLAELARAVEDAAPAKSAPRDAPLAPSRGEARREHARGIRAALERGHLNAYALLEHAACGDLNHIRSVAAALQLDGDLLVTLVQNAFKPALRAWRRELAEVVGEVEWPRDLCYICGAPAVFAELQGNEGARHLRCAQCGADWPAARLRCAHCGNEDHRTLGQLYAEGQREPFRVDVCDRCHRYLKVIATFAPTPVELLPVLDLATLHLDYIAQERGYRKVAGEEPAEDKNHIAIEEA